MTHKEFIAEIVYKPTMLWPYVASIPMQEKKGLRYTIATICRGVEAHQLN